MGTLLRDLVLMLIIAMAASVSSSLQWSATAGSITSNGVFTAPAGSALVTVSAQTAAVVATSVVTVQPGIHRVDLSWEASGSPNVIGYRVYRSLQSGGPYRVIADTASTQYMDTDVNSGTTYFYVVTAVNNQHEQSTYSNQAVAKIPA